MRRLKRYERHSDFELGAGWYPDARAVTKRIATTFKQPVALVAGLLAITSQRQTIPNNIRLTVAALRGEPLPGAMTLMAGKVERLLQGEPLEAVTGGPKLRAFYHALMGKDVLVLDTWAFRALGYPDNPTKAQTARAKFHYRSRARALDLPVADYQAGVWVAVRKEAGYKTASYMGDVLERYL